MGKYTALETDIYSVFHQVGGWPTTGIDTHPVNFVPPQPASRFIKVAILPSDDGVNINSVSGIIMIDIFTSAGNGQTDAFDIADKLDTYMVGKTFNVGSGSTQCGKSAVRPEGIDKDNPALYRTTYTIPFNYYGVN